ERTIGLLEEKAVLRIDALRFLRSNAEEQRIETVDVVERSHPFGVFLPAHVPPLARHFGDGVLSLDQVVPEFLQIIRLWISARHADDGDPVVGRLPASRRRAGSASLSLQRETWAAGRRRGQLGRKKRRRRLR